MDRLIDCCSLVAKIHEWTRADERVLEERLSDALKNYCEEISTGVKYTGFADVYDIFNEASVYKPSKTFKKRLQKLCDYILSTYVDYNNGTIAKCIMNKWWKNYQKDWSFATIHGGGPQRFYRMRSKVEGTKTYKIFKRKDLFHVPFDKREAIKAYRFSMIGMPCLYLGCSIYVCWEEMRRTVMDDLMISAFALNEKCSLNLLDLRIKREIKSQQELINYLMTLPLIIACSFKVKSDDGIYKPEYVFPQLVMHMIVQNSASDRKIDGVYFDTTQQEEDFESYIGNDLRMIENIAIPVYKVSNKGHCARLKTMFTLTEPTTKEYEENKDPLYGIASSNPVENTIFYVLEERIDKKEFGPIE